jgi:DMSO/TMAO reductase YedYZ molybdopterin-dependent catalytic subunit
MSTISRRTMIRRGFAAAAGLSGLAVAGRIADRYGLVPPDRGGIYGPGATLTYAAQRLLTRNSLAREFSRSQISNPPFANRTRPPSDIFKRLQAEGFKDWRLSVEGLVAQPASLSLDDVKRFPARRQITELACEEGWSYIAEWIGTPLADVLHATGVMPQARYVVYFSIQRGWWDSIDMADARHPQTLVVYAMNDADLPPAFGGPLRLRVPRQLGYKSVKFINRLAVTDSLEGFGKGLGSGAREGGYAWYAGI